MGHIWAPFEILYIAHKVLSILFSAVKKVAEYKIVCDAVVNASHKSLGSFKLLLH